MPSPYTSHAGTVTDVHGKPVRIGTDCDAVTIGEYTIGLKAMDDLLRHVSVAEQDATVWAEKYSEDD